MLREHFSQLLYPSMGYNFPAFPFFPFNSNGNIPTLLPLTPIIQSLEPRIGLREQSVWVIKLFENAMVQNSDFIEVDDGFEFVRDGDDGVFGKLLADDTLD